MQDRTGRELFWAHRGFSGNRRWGFEPDQLVRAAVAKGGSFDDVVETYINTLVPSLTRVLPHFKQDAPTLYDSYITRQTFILELYIVRSSSVGIEAELVGFRIVKGKPTPFPIKCPAPSNGCLLVFRQPAVTEYVQTHPKFLASGPVATIDQLMSIGHSLDPDNIGPPYSILRINSQGAEWLRQGLCKSIKPFK